MMKTFKNTDIKFLTLKLFDGKTNAFVRAKVFDSSMNFIGAYSLGHIEIVDSTPQNGEIKISLTDADTALIKKGDKQSFEVELHEGTKLSIVQFKEELQVLTRI